MREIVLSPGMTITESARIAPGSVHLADPDGAGAVRIVGEDIVLDFDGAELVGCAEGATPDSFDGTGIVVRGGVRVTIRNARVRGYKTAIYVQGGEAVRVEGCDLSGNYAMRLGSTPEREDPADWLWPHQNDANEWMTEYGANLYVEECTGAVLCNNRGEGSQNGILLDGVEDSYVFDNDFSFNSGWGLAMWRSARNEITHNRFDWCVRGYSHGVYWRGQDSAGILVFEQCHENLFAFNSATHGGDGFFLFAGNETLRETGEGGCNGNVLYRNDFSHAVANGIEATFSANNKFLENRLDDCQHGIWGGYSYKTWIAGNMIRRCAGAGIAIEHGHENVIEANDFEGNPVAIRLWWDENPDLTGGVYGRKQNTRSERNAILRNRFQGDGIAISLRDTQTTRIEGNAWIACRTPIEQIGNCSGTIVEKNREGLETGWQRGDVRTRRYDLPPIRGVQPSFLPDGAPRGRDRIIIGEWGPLKPDTLES